MNTPLPNPPRTTARRGFTLLELLVVIGIIIILIGILIPVIGKVRLSAQVASTKQEINQISDAIERYHTDLLSYPGPIPNSDFTGATVTLGGLTVTQTENMILGLLGGLVWDNTSATPTATIAFESSQEPSIGQGPMDNNQIRPHRLGSYIPDSLSLLPPKPWKDNGVTGQNDSVIPEFTDRIGSNPTHPSVMGRPIMYLRANVGNPANAAGKVVTANNNTQYNTNWMRPYLLTKPIYLSKSPTQVKEWPGPAAFTNSAGVAGNWNDYFLHPTLPNTPKGKDAFILISAGPDGVFGTDDDILNVGLK